MKARSKKAAAKDSKAGAGTPDATQKLGRKDYEKELARRDRGQLEDQPQVERLDRVDL